MQITGECETQRQAPIEPGANVTASKVTASKVTASGATLAAKSEVCFAHFHARSDSFYALYETTLFPLSLRNDPFHFL